MFNLYLCSLNISWSAHIHHAQQIIVRVSKKSAHNNCYAPSLDLDIPDLNMTLMMCGKGKKRVALCALFFTQIDRHNSLMHPRAYFSRTLEPKAAWPTLSRIQTKFDPALLYYYKTSQQAQKLAVWFGERKPSHITPAQLPPIAARFALMLITASVCRSIRGLKYHIHTQKSSVCWYPK